MLAIKTFLSVEKNLFSKSLNSSFNFVSLYQLLSAQEDEKAENTVRDQGDLGPML
jgi:hypothetical protein